MQKKILTLLLIIFGLAGASAAQLTLDEAQGIALEHNLQFQLAQQKVRTGEAKYKESLAGLYPQIGLTSSYTRMKEQPPLFPGLPSGSPQNYTVQFSLQQPIYPGVNLGKLPAVSESQLEMIRLEETRARQQLKGQVASAYYNALSAQEMVKVTREAIALAEKQLEKAQAFYDAGIVLKTDVLRAELAVGNLKQNLLAAENGAAIARFSLEATVGISLEGFQLIPPGAPQVLLAVDKQEALALALKNRPELKQAYEGAKQAEFAVELAQGGKRPQVALVGNYGWQGSELDFSAGSWNVTLTARLPLFDGGAQNAKIQQAKEGVLGAQLGQRQLEQGISLEIQAAAGSLLEAKERLPYAQKALEQAQANLRIAQARYNEGLGVITEVLEAQTALDRAQADQIQAIYNYYLAVEKLELALGTEIPETWEVLP